MLFVATVVSVHGAERPSFQTLRYNEDWSFLRDPAQRADPFDPMKFMRLSHIGDSCL